MKKVSFVFLLALMCISAIAQNQRLWYAKPASHWLDQQGGPNPPRLQNR